MNNCVDVVCVLFGVFIISFWLMLIFGCLVVSFWIIYYVLGVDSVCKLVISVIVLCVLFSVLELIVMLIECGVMFCVLYVVFMLKCMKCIYGYVVKCLCVVVRK